MGKSSSPSSPDTAGAARETAAGNLKVAQAAASANRVNQSSPWGSLQYSQSGTDAQGNPTYTATQSLPGELQGTAQNLMGNVASNFSTPFDTSQLPALQVNPGQTAQDAIMARLNPQFDRQQSQLETKLANQGIAPGTEAWKNAEYDLNTARNDAMTQAALQGINVGQGARQQALQEQSFLRNEPLNAMQALKSGTQLTPYSGGQQATTQGPDILGAQQAKYAADLGSSNAQNAQTNSLMNTGLMAYAAYMMSDRRLKRNIKKVGKTPSGLNIYSYDYIWGEPSIGVMADEVEKVIPEAVAVHPSGYKMVNYAKVH